MNTKLFALALLASVALAAINLGGDDVIIVSDSSRASKLSELWNNLVNSKYDTLPSFKNRDITNPFKLLEFAGENMEKTFNPPAETLPGGRKKLIHPLGSIAQVEYRSYENHQYTGMFQGGDSCVARLSLAADPESIGFAPGMAIKCFTEGNNPSVNFISMYSLDGQGEDYNFFSNEFSNIVEEPASMALKVVESTVFNRASKCATWLSLEQFASLGNEGQLSGPVSHPVQLFLVPTKEAQFSSAKGRDFRNDLETLSAGTKLWYVEATATRGGERVRIGEIATRSSFISAKYCDETLFFQHSKGENDGC